MKLKKEILFFILLIFVLFSSSASAEIIVGQTNTVYNLGDQFTLAVELIPSGDTSDFFTIALICPDREVELYRVPYELKAGTRQQITISSTFGKFLTGDAVGQCFIINIIQDSGGSRTVTWFSTIKWAGGSAPTLTTTANKIDTLGFIVSSAGNYYGYVVGANL